MRRRELLAGVGSVAALGAGAVIATRGVPSVGGSDAESIRRITVDTIDAPGSEAGSIELPAPGRPTFIDFFATWCNPCEKQMPALAAANDRIGGDVRFVSVTTEGIPEAEIVEWWAEHDGDWLLAHDPTTELTAEYSPPGIPYAVAVDAAGRIRWSEPGRKTADEFVAGIEQAME